MFWGGKSGELVDQLVKELLEVLFHALKHRVNREDNPIIILDNTLVPDFVLHACFFSIAGNRPVLKRPHSTNKSLSYENRDPKSSFVSDPESETFFLITYEISQLGRFLYFIYCLSTKVDILLKFRMPYN